MLSWPDAPDWSDHEAVAELESARADILGDDPVAARVNAAHIWDRTPGTAPPVQMGNQMGMVFSQSAYIARTAARRPMRSELPSARDPPSFTAASSLTRPSPIAQGVKT
jgi:hypothetical protein